MVYEKLSVAIQLPAAAAETSDDITKTRAFASSTFSSGHVEERFTQEQPYVTSGPHSRQQKALRRLLERGADRMVQDQ
ncbi:hypothetical protein PROFUN_02495 [Planoprotostelium fungivorum]|uniref:Uncharacterized protein n=1 Tax=Planoprotostelium fungivorum TaxID=1890364 RepID=A0A2P6MP90_9EUKA|nr:hypothetical protein PROFUN_02495 [Planoprotostelium fungivorum]